MRVANAPPPSVPPLFELFLSLLARVAVCRHDVGKRGGIFSIPIETMRVANNALARVYLRVRA